MPHLIPAVWGSFLLFAISILLIRAKLRGTLFRTNSKIRARVVNLRIRQSHKKLPLFEELSNEVKILNGMKLVMECQNGLPVTYINFLGKLYISPRFRPRNMIPEIKVLYLYAVMNLMSKEKNILKNRQYEKSLLWMYNSNREVIKKRVGLTKLDSRIYSTQEKTLFKVIGGKVKVLEQGSISYPSYILTPQYKHYHDKNLPVECFEIRRVGQFKLKISDDKAQWAVASTVDTLYFVNRKQGSVEAIYTTAKSPQFQTTIARKKKALEITFEVEEGIKVFKIIGTTKQEVQATIATIKDRRHCLDYLLDNDESKLVIESERLLNIAHNSRYLSSANLSTSFKDAQRFIPTLHQPSIIHEIDTGENFFSLIDSMPILKFLSIRMSIIVVHSSQNPHTLSIIQAFTNKEEVKELISRGILFFFIDRMKTPANVLAVLSDMSQAKSNPLSLKSHSSHPAVLVSSQTAHNITSIFLASGLNKSVRVTATIPLSLASGFNIYKRTGRKLFVKGAEYRLPFNCRVITPAGVVEDGEFMTDQIAIQVDVSLRPYEERVLEIIKKEKQATAEIGEILLAKVI